MFHTDLRFLFAHRTPRGPVRQRSWRGKPLLWGEHLLVLPQFSSIRVSSRTVSTGRRIRLYPTHTRHNPHPCHKLTETLQETSAVLMYTPFLTLNTLTGDSTVYPQETVGARHGVETPCDRGYPGCGDRSPLFGPKIKLEQITAGATVIPLCAPLTKNPQGSVRSQHHLVTLPWARFPNRPGVDVGVHPPGPQLGCRDTPDHEHEQHEGHKCERRYPRHTYRSEVLFHWYVLRVLSLRDVNKPEITPKKITSAQH